MAMTIYAQSRSGGEGTHLLEEARRQLAVGELPGAIYHDPEIFELEMEKIFARAWVYLAHESEIPNAGDYVVRYIGRDSFILIRDENGNVRAHFNMCRHRGMQVCRSEMGNASHFRCPYHGWTYRNDGTLVGVPAGKEAYGDRLNKEAWGLIPIPRLDQYNGMIFGSLDPKAPSLDEWLGDMKWYLDLFTRRSAAGLEVIGAPHRWMIDADWKLGADNFVGDAYHTLMTHRSMVELGLAPRDPQFAMYGEHVHIPGKGHGLGMIGAPPNIPLPPFWGYPEEIVRSLKENYPSEAHVRVAEKLNFVHGTVFPNLSILNVMIGRDHVHPPTPMLTFRLWHPIAPGKMEVWSWFLVEKDAPEWFKEQSRLTYLRTFGTSGVFEQDDAEMWRGITRAAGGEMARRNRMNYQMGMDHLAPDPNWPGPGVAYPLDYAEANQRNFYARWLEMLEA
ncbi:Rieske 2Fe-2S domain-containing protein [Hydrogenibacillus schlegelii]|nr:Rieske 2Fe-2S domain-containing protein [Hydrogenibacillus schlegelii]KWW97019.1 ribosomal subunit interface protein [Hydrogenibacillus schlegelii]